MVEYSDSTNTFDIDKPLGVIFKITVSQETGHENFFCRPLPKLLRFSFFSKISIHSGRSFKIINDTNLSFDLFNHRTDFVQILWAQSCVLIDFRKVDHSF